MKPAGYAVVLLIIAAVALSAGLLARGAEPAPKIELSADGAGPREIEETTEKAIVRDYGVAWKALSTALAENRASALDAGFVGYARDKFARRIEEQQRAGLRTRYLDRGHQLEAVFYSPEGSAMQLRDVARLEVQVLDGDQVVSTQQVTQMYLAIMTVTEERWKVRVLQEVP